MNPDNQLQRGCRSCEEIERHKPTCIYWKKDVTGTDAVLDTERVEAEGGVPPETIWMRSETMRSAELLEHFTRLNSDDIQYRRVKTCRWIPSGDITVPYYITGCGNRGNTSRHEEKFCGFCSGRMEVV